MSVAFISHSDCLLHDLGPDHPECPARLHAINDRLIASGLEMALRQFDAPQVERALLERVHDPTYVAHILDDLPEEGRLWLDVDTAVSKAGVCSALHAAGAAVLGVELVMRGEVQVAFCAVRPPGHHAGWASSGGFCIFNNVAIAATHAFEAYGLERIAVVDFDAHHGNGTEELFADDPRLLFCSSFEHPLYPFCGVGTHSDHVVNVPLDGGITGAVFRERVAERWLPALERFAPQLMLVSAGFDGHAEDDMSHLRLREPDYRWATQRIKTIAERHAQGRIVSVLEGGYALSALGRSVAAHIDVLIGGDGAG